MDTNLESEEDPVAVKMTTDVLGDPVSLFFTPEEEDVLVTNNRINENSVRDMVLEIRHLFNSNHGLRVFDVGGQDQRAKVFHGQFSPVGTGTTTSTTAPSCTHCFRSACLNLH